VEGMNAATMEKKVAKPIGRIQPLQNSYSTIFSYVEGMNAATMEKKVAKPIGRIQPFLDLRVANMLMQTKRLVS
jgi:hypothetical protein